MSLSTAMQDLLNRSGVPFGRAKLGDLVAQIVTAGNHTTVGGDANESIVDANILATDLVFVNLEVKGATPRTILTAVANASGGAIDVVMSGDPSTDHVLTYLVIRPVVVA